MKDYKHLFTIMDSGINLDNAATTKPFKSVIKEIIRFFPYYSSVNRGIGPCSKANNYIFEHGRKVILDFVSADRDEYDVIYIKNATEGINKLSYRIFDKTNPRILISRMEHHANDLPWRRAGIVFYTDVLDDGRLDLNKLEDNLKKINPDLLCISGASNVTGYINDLASISFLCSKYKTKLLVDGAQLIPHCKINLSKVNIDYLVFSAHKMYAPFGIGIIVCKKQGLSSNCPEYLGGGAVEFVTEDRVIFKEGPYKDEPGTPNIFGILALTKSIQELEQIGMDNVLDHERIITKYALNEFSNRNYVKLYGDINFSEDRLGIIPFNILDNYCDDIAKKLGEYNVSVRSGCFCSHIYVSNLLSIDKDKINDIIEKKLKKPGLIRISFALYNDIEDIDKFFKILDKICLG